MLNANFWQDKNNSQKVIKEKKFYEDLTNSYNNNSEKLKDLDDLNQLAFEEENLQVQKEVLQNIKDLRSEVKKNEIKCFLSNEPCLLYTSPSPRDRTRSRMPSSA